MVERANDRANERNDQTSERTRERASNQTNERTKSSNAQTNGRTDGRHVRLLSRDGRAANTALLEPSARGETQRTLGELRATQPSSHINRASSLFYGRLSHPVRSFTAVPAPSPYLRPSFLSVSPARCPNAVKDYSRYDAIDTNR